MDSKQKFETFLESLKKNDNKALIESVKKGFKVCYENVNGEFVFRGNASDGEWVKKFDTKEELLDYARRYYPTEFWGENNTSSWHTGEAGQYIDIEGATFNEVFTPEVKEQITKKQQDYYAEKYKKDNAE